jgi:hypothetical protein
MSAELQFDAIGDVCRKIVANTLDPDVVAVPFEIMPEFKPVPKKNPVAE